MIDLVTRDAKQDLILLMYIRRRPNGELAADFRFNPKSNTDFVKAMRLLHYALDQVDITNTSEIRNRRRDGRMTK